MITLLGAIFGFFSSIFPEIMKLLQGRQDNSHELAMYQLQIEALKVQGNQKMEELVAQGDIESIKGSYAPQQIINIKWVDALNGTVKPVITYFFFGIYAYIKIVHLHHVDWSVIIDTPWQVWGNEDSGMLATILGHHFGNRMMLKARASA